MSSLEYAGVLGLDPGLLAGVSKNIGSGEWSVEVADVCGDSANSDCGLRSDCIFIVSLKSEEDQIAFHGRVGWEETTESNELNCCDGCLLNFLSQEGKQVSF